MAWTCWLYYFSKFIEMLDTVSVGFVSMFLLFSSCCVCLTWLSPPYFDRFSLCWEKRTAKSLSSMCTITQSCPSHGGLESSLLQVECQFIWVSCFFHPPPIYPMRNDEICPFFFRWSGNLPCPAELLCPCDHVYILCPVCYGPSLSEIPLVEEVHDDHSASKSWFFIVQVIVSILLQTISRLQSSWLDLLCWN